MTQLKTTFEVIPDELRARNQWMAWRRSQYNARARTRLQVIRDGRDSRPASYKEPTNWSSARHAIAWAKAEQNAIAREIGPEDDGTYWAGIAYVLKPGERLIVVELLECFGESWALEVIEEFDTYTEINPKGTGYRLIIRAEKPENMNKSGKYVYDGLLKLQVAPAFIPLTGNRVSGTPPAIQDRQAALEHICADLIPTRKRTPAPNEAPDTADSDEPSLPTENTCLIPTMKKYRKPLAGPEKVFDPETSVYRTDKHGNKMFEKPIGTTDNLKRMLDKYGIKVRYNQITRETEITFDGKRLDGDMSPNAELTAIEDIAGINRFPRELVARGIDAIANTDAYNPVADWVRSRPWDGNDHIRQLFDTLELPEDTSEKDRKTAWLLFRKWFIGAVAIGMGLTNKFEFVLVLVDIKGGIGKTAWFNTLCPEEWRDDGLKLNPENKDDMTHAVQNWLVELGELDATFSAAEISMLKSMLSRQSDVIRQPYARKANRYPRRTAFLGTINNIEFLRDSTNNRRFWPIAINRIDYNHKVDMQQVWAEAHAKYQGGEKHWLDPVENDIIGDYNEQFRELTISEELILAKLDTSKKVARPYKKTAAQVLDSLGIKNPSRSDKTRAGRILGKYFRKTKTNGVRAYEVPEPKQGYEEADPSPSHSSPEDTDEAPNSYAETRDPG